MSHLRIQHEKGYITLSSSYPFPPITEAEKLDILTPWVGYTTFLIFFKVEAGRMHDNLSNNSNSLQANFRLIYPLYTSFSFTEKNVCIFTFAKTLYLKEKEAVTVSSSIPARQRSG